MEPTTSDPAIVAREVVRRYGSLRALDSLSLEVPAGSIFGLVGPNGSGNSTFLSLVAGADLPDGGELTVLGQVPTSGLRSKMGVVFQENATDPLMTPLATCTLAGRLHGLSRKEAADRAAASLQTVGLQENMMLAVDGLSGGMRRRLELGRALITNPPLLLLDEPTTGVDPGERKAFWEAIYLRGERFTTVVATNDLAEADTVCDTIAFLVRGRAVAVGSPNYLKRGLKAETLRLQLDSVADDTTTRIRELRGVASVWRRGNEVRLATDDAAELVPRVVAALRAQVRSISLDRASLEDAYFAIVGSRSAVRPNGGDEGAR